MRVVAAMSGGVDSAVAAARVVAAGHDVTGVHLALNRNPASYRSGARGCCTLEDARDARRAADRLGIPFYVWDMSAEFAAEVVDDFLGEYAAGRTPNPCLRCNERIKFSAVLDRSLALGFDAVCTGHYARIVATPAGPQLHRAADPAKDQSYVLGVLTQPQLEHCAFPLGDTPKSQVRAEADRLGLQVAAKPDSHDICFIPSGDTGGWLQDRLGSAAGDIVDAESGAILGQHPAAFRFTVGQRRGLRLGRPAEDGQRRYVVGVDPASRTVLVGPPRLLEVDRIHANRLHWCGPPAASPFAADVQVRAHGSPEPATVHWSDDSMTIQPIVPMRGIAAGQAAVLYDGTRVIGSGTITGTGRAGQAAPG